MDDGEETDEDRQRHERWVAKYKLHAESERLQKVIDCPVSGTLSFLSMLLLSERHRVPCRITSYGLAWPA